MRPFQRGLLLLISVFSCFLLAQANNQATLEAELKKKPDSLRLRMELANLHSRENRPDKVIDLLNPYTDQLDNTGFLLLASSYSAKKDYANEARVLLILSAKDEQNYQWHMLLGQAYLKRASQNPSADNHASLLTSGIQELRKTLQLNKKFKPAFDLLLNTLLEEGSNNESRELLMEGLQKFGQRPELFRELCRIDATDGFLVQAVQNCRMSIKMSPNFADHYVYLAQALHDQQEDQQAERTILNAAKRFTKSEFVQWAAGTLFLRKKNYPVASRYFRAALQADAKESRSHIGMAESLFESGSEQQALEHFVAACKADGASLEKFMAAGGRLKQKGNMELGTKYIQAANTCR